jgi:hypothetical protein
MKTRYTVALSMIAGAALGGAAIQGLHAQAKPPVYYVAEIEVTNPDAYAKEYAPKAQALIKAAGGKLLAVGGAAAAGGAKVTGFDGEPPKRAGGDHSRAAALGYAARGWVLPGSSARLTPAPSDAPTVCILEPASRAHTLCLRTSSAPTRPSREPTS